MFIFGFLLLVVAALLILAAVFGGAEVTSIDLGFVHFDLSLMAVFFLGMIAMALIALALSLFRRAAAKANERRRERKEMGTLKDRLDKYESQEDRRHGDDAPPAD